MALPSLKRVLLEVAQVALAAVGCIALYAGASFFFGPESFDYIRAVKAELSERPRIFVGGKLSLRDDSIQAHGSALVVIISPDCPYCSASGPFYARLVAQTQKSTPIIVALPLAAKGRKYALSLGFKTQRLVDWKELGLTALGTPTLALVGGDGTVRDMWIGKLGERDEIDVFDALNHPDRQVKKTPLHGQPLLDWKEVRRLMTMESIQIVSTSSRAAFAARHYPTPVVDIPFDEIAALAPVKLQEDVLHVLDCSALPETICQLRLSQFNALGFRTIGMSGWIEE